MDSLSISFDSEEVVGYKGDGDGVDGDGLLLVCETSVSVLQGEKLSVSRLLLSLFQIHQIFIKSSESLL